MAENSGRAERVLTALKPLIGTDAGNSIKTSSFSVQPFHEFDPVDKKNVLRGFRARHQVAIKTTKTELAGTIIDRAIQNGANIVDSVAFTITDSKNYCEAVLKKAADKAQQEAAFVAAAFGERLAGIKSISPACGTDKARPLYRDAMMTMQAEAPRGTGIEAGEVEVHASLAVTFYLSEK